MEEQILDVQNAVPQKSQLLKVLCILSFVMCGLTLILGVMNIFQSSPEVMQQKIEQLRPVMPEMADQMENQMIAMQNNTYAAIAPYLKLVYTFISFLGVLMMWNLKRAGFYIYCIAEILPYTDFIFLGKNSLSLMGGESMAAIGMAVIVLMVIIDLVFVGLYAKCLKELK